MVPPVRHQIESRRDPDLCVKTLEPLQDLEEYFESDGCPFTGTRTVSLRIGSYRDRLGYYYQPLHAYPTVVQDCKLSLDHQ